MKLILAQKSTTNCNQMVTMKNQVISTTLEPRLSLSIVPYFSLGVMVQNNSGCVNLQTIQ